jgi:hypothetical protein
MWNPWRWMTPAKIMMVAMRFITFSSWSLQNASLSTHPLSFHVNSKWKRATMAPSNSGPLPVLTVVGEKAFHMILSQMLVAMKRVMPELSP